MPGPDFSEFPTWWQSLLGGLGALLIGWAGGHRRRRGSASAETVEDGAAVVAIEAKAAEFRSEHEETRNEVREMLRAMREEREVMVNLIRSEGRDNRAAIYALGKSISDQVATMHRDMVDRTVRRNGP